MDVLIDTNVLLDRALGRAGAADALLVIQRCVWRGFGLWVAWHSLSNLDYIMRTAKRDRATRESELRLIIQQCRVAPTTETDAAVALGLDFSDFEDALQTAAAMQCGASLIVTNNISDFGKSPVPALTPADFLAHYP